MKKKHTQQDFSAYSCLGFLSPTTRPLVGFGKTLLFILKGRLLLLPHRRRGKEVQADRTQAVMSPWRGEEGQSSAGIDW